MSNINELHEALQAVQVVFPETKWDTDDHGNIVFLTYTALEVD